MAQDGIDLDHLHWGTFRDWCELVRLPNAFTLISDCLAAAVIAGSLLRPVTAFLPTLIASLMAYWAGMILNDVVDLEEDRASRPDRPLASGRISPVIAGHVATGLLLLAPILVLATATVHQAQALWTGAAFVSAVLLSVTVRLYDSPLKGTPLGPLLMGLCRTFNILMVACSLFGVGAETNFPPPVLYFALGIGLYIMGVTIYARREERESAATGLTVGLLLEVGGLVIVACLPRWAQEQQAWGGNLTPLRGYPLLIGLIGLTVVNRAVIGIMNPSPRHVQLAVKHALLTLILIDASVAWLWAGTWYGLAVAALLLPALSSALRFRTT